MSSLAIVVAVVALVISALLASRQLGLLQSANHIPAVIELLTEFRSARFHDNYEKIVTELDRENPAQIGISGLPPDMRAAVLDVAYYFQAFACLIGLGIIDESSTMAMLNRRFVQVWDAIAPYAYVERTMPGRDGQFLTILEFFAERARETPAGTASRRLRMRALLGLPRRPWQVR